MKSFQPISLLALAAQAAAHGYIYRVEADNTVYPGWDVRLDPQIDPTPDRIAYGGGDVTAVMDPMSKDIACNRVHSPPPGDIATVRAGSNVTFYWSHWLYSHKGPITAWMAPYEGDIADVDVNELEFIKFSEDTVDEDGIWANVRMIDDNGGTYTAQIPADIKPGKYVIRNEIIALHFARQIEVDGLEMLGTGPQFYLTCFNFEVTGDGDATPKGAKFPGAYDPDAPGLSWDLESTDAYPTVGPDVYVSEYDVDLDPKPRILISPTNDGPDADAQYFEMQERVLAQQGATTTFFDSIGG